jgi:glucose-1-phosphate adenylyltransferase
MQELTGHRPLAAVPFGGRYRLIDFALSNMVNSGITDVGILFQHKYRALMDHLRSGKEWDLARKHGGMVILPPAYSNYPQAVQYGDVENFFSNLDYIRYSKHKYVAISGSNFVLNVDYRPALKLHCEKQADITIIYGEITADAENYKGATLVGVDETGRVTDIKVCSNVKPRSLSKIALNMCIIERGLLIDLIEDCMARDGHDFIKHCLIRNSDRLKIYGFAHRGYYARIASMQSYFKCNMDLLNPNIWKELFFANGLIYTKVKDEPPTKYTEHANVTNSLVAAGCYIEGTVENSILFRGVRVGKGAHIKNSIIMQKGDIAENVSLQNVICDKNVSITAGRHLKGEVTYPLVIKKGRVI